MADDAQRAALPLAEDLRGLGRMGAPLLDAREQGEAALQLAELAGTGRELLELPALEAQELELLMLSRPPLSSSVSSRARARQRWCTAR
jgi:hypothetical protein